MNALAKKILPDRITSYDLLKFFAVVTMIIDHVGAYFYPEDLWWRDIGRLSGPVWLFLVGFARSRDLSPRLWIGAQVLIAASFLCGSVILPVNILPLMIIIRLLIDRVGPYMLSEKTRFWAVVAVLFIGGIMTNMLVDYGSIGFMIGLSGYMARRRIDGQPVKDERSLLIFSGFSYFALAFLSFEFSSAQLAVLAAGTVLVFGALYRFSPSAPLPSAQKLPRPVQSFLRFCGRRTLEIYVAHLLLFKAIAATYGLHGHSFMDWYWVDI